MKLFVDTGGWLSAFNPRDQFYPRVRSQLQEIEGQSHRLITTDYVLDETITSLMGAVYHAAAEKFAMWALAQRHVQIIHVNETLWDEALTLFRRYDDKKFSFTDCTSFVIMRQQKLRDAFGFDSHFEQMGFRLWPR